MISIDTIRLAAEPMGMRAGTDTAMARVIPVFDAAQPHCAYLFATRRSTLMKVLVHDGLGIWQAARRLHQGKFAWPSTRHGSQVALAVGATEDAEWWRSLIEQPWPTMGRESPVGLIGGDLGKTDLGRWRNQAKFAQSFQAVSVDNSSDIRGCPVRNLAFEDFPRSERHR